MRSIYILLFQLLSSIVLAQNPFFFQYSIKTGLPSNTVYYAMQDSEGFMWMGTDAGVCRYDGNDVTTFLPQDDLSDNEIFQIHEDSQRRIWFFPFNGRICYYKDNVIHNDSNDPQLAALSVKGIYSCFFEDRLHRIWFGTQQSGLLILKPNGEIIRPSFLKGAIFKVWEDNHIIYVLTTHGVFAMRPHDLSKASKLMSIDSGGEGHDVSKKSYVDTINHIVYLPKSDRGLLMINYAKKSIKIVKEDETLNGFYIANDTTQLIYSGNGAVEYRDENNVMGPSPGPLLEANVSFIMQDRSGGYWITTLNNGTFYTPSFSVKYFLISDDLVENQVHRIMKNRDGNIWAIKKGGSYAVIHQPQNSITTHPSLLPPHIFVSEAKVISDTIFISSSRGLRTISGNYDGFYFTNVAIKSFAKLQNKLWLSAGISGIREYDFPKIKKEGTQAEAPLRYGKQILNNRTFSVFAEDYTQHLRVWFGTQQGLAVYENNHTQFLSHLHPFLQNRASQILQDKKGNMWIVMDATGIVVISPQLKVIGVIGEDVRFYQEKCSRLFIDEMNVIWFITKHSLFQVSLDEMRNKFTFETIFTLQNDVMNDLSVDHHNIWLASTAGLLQIPRGFKQNQKIHTHLEFVYINSKKVDINNNKSITVSHDQNNLRVNFKAISYTSTSPLFRYRINPHDTTWTYTQSNELEFPSLSPGTYHFQLQARNSDWSWNQKSSSFQIKIENPFWRNWWFIVVCSLTVIIMITSVIWKISSENLRKLILQERLLESEFKALTAQMNPHFIFNTLNTVQRFFMTQEIRTANKLMSQFSKLIRMTLEHTLKSFITLEDEITYLKNYLEIEQTRFNQKFSFSIIVDSNIDVSMVTIPSMILQPFVENSIIHGFSPEKDGGQITISFINKNNFLVIIIDDNGAGRYLRGKKDHTSRGISLIRERFDILNSKNSTSYSIHIIDKKEPEKGTRVEISL